MTLIIKAFQIMLIVTCLVDAVNPKTTIGVIWLNIIMLYVCLVWSPFFKEKNRGGNNNDQGV
jgi:hypothetical protein